MTSDDPIDLSGLLLREGGGFILQSDHGTTWRLVLHRVPVDLVAKRVRVIGVQTGEDVIDVEGVQPA